jgi:REP element-mobilizing transposase RayT
MRLRLFLLLMPWKERKGLPHDRPTWVSAADPIFLTLCGRPRGVNQFAKADRWSAILAASAELESLARWRPLLILAMPDHLHLIVLIPRMHGIDSVMADFKRSISVRQPIDWQRGGFDHRLRNRPQLRAKWNYVLMNPSRAGLCQATEDWPYIYSPGRART